MLRKIPEDPMGAFDDLKTFLQKYVTSAFATNSISFEEDRQKLLDAPGAFFQQPILEPLPEYDTDKSIGGLSDADLPDLSPSALEGFKCLVSCSLVPQEFSLYKHQQRMLRENLLGKHAVVVTGTGSGKTEAFLLPVLAQICKEALSNSKNRHWPPPAKTTNSKQTNGHIPKWSETSSSLRGESRQPAVRALILYPMNALVEDQISRLRLALDSDEARAVFDDKFNGNRIRFGRFNGSTPVSGHPTVIGENGNKEPNQSKRSELRNKQKAAIEQSMALDKKILELEKRISAASSETNIEEISLINDELELVKEQRSFIPRVDVNSAEMFHRWEMQKSPPDILITNTSMLSIMLMRSRHSEHEDNSADGDMLEATKNWLNSDRQNVFQLVIDELHLYRGADGTEVAYLLRLFLARLDLNASSAQLRILASSASLDGERGYKFLGEMFGLTETEARSSCHIESGELIFRPAESASHGLGVNLYEILVPQMEKLIDSPDSLQRAVDLLGAENFPRKFLMPFLDKEEMRYRATPFKQVAANWFPSVSEENAEFASGQLLKLIGFLSNKDQYNLPTLPRLRFHWMMKNISGLWATGNLDEYSADLKRRIGKLSAEPNPTFLSDRFLEALYCECCGTQFLSGFRIPFSGSQTELSFLPANPEQLPDDGSVIRTDESDYATLGVVHLQNNSGGSGRLGDSWRQSSSARNANGNPLSKAVASWEKAKYNFTTGIVTIGNFENLESTETNCLFFVLDSPVEDHSRYKAMPQKCPECLTDYSPRAGGRYSPIRAVATGLVQMSLLLSKHLMMALPAGASRKLVAFSDSRQAAAKLADDVEKEQWVHLIQHFVLGEIESNANNPYSVAASRLFEIFDQQGIPAAEKYLLHCKEEFEDEIFRQLVSLYSDYKLIAETPDFASVEQKERISTIRDLDHHSVRLDDIFRGPAENQRRSGLWSSLINLGTSPAGPNIKFQRWAELFDFSDAPPALRPKNELRAEDRNLLEDIGLEVRKASWKAVAGKLLYDLEAKGFGFFRLAPTSVVSFSGSIPASSFSEICSSVLRIMTEEHFVNPYPFDNGEASVWRDDEPNARSGYKKKRISNYLQACADSWSVPFEVLIDGVRKQLVSAGHQWGVVQLSHLWVRVVDEDFSILECASCGRIHLHSSGKICSRCFAPLTTEQLKKTARSLRDSNYYAALSSKGDSVLRMHAEELTGQTDSQSQRQRHFREIFYDGENLIEGDSGSRKAVPAVDAIDLLSVTTTMEVGVDIGALQAVFQANMPPERFNYQQRVGRAGRKKQPFSVALTYSRGQTHDRIHFDHPKEMTGGNPPQPSLSVGPDQQILANRLMAKEVLRNAFQYAGLTWSDSGRPPDNNGEMGLIRRYVVDADLRLEISGWLQTNGSQIQKCAENISRGTGINASSLVDFAVNKLLPACDEILRSEVNLDKGVATTLAEAGVLPMYGMPTMVRDLYFDLPRATANPQPKTLDRNLSQAILEYAPDSELVWDKRLLRVRGISGSIRASRVNNWEVFTPAVSSIQKQTFCKSCRHFTVEEMELADVSDVAYVDCESCGERGAEQYCAVTPVAFITDFRMDIPTKEASRDDSKGATSIVAAPKLEDVELRHVGGAGLLFSSQGQVFKVSQRADGKPFPFSRKKVISLPRRAQDSNEQKLFSSEQDLWEVTDNQPELSVKFFAPKTTDLLGVRVFDRSGLGFFDKNARLAARRAAWYSAATILHRAIAIDLDVDSTSIEIASVHLYRAEAESGAELYLADEHPNGAGLVAWANENWSSLLLGCVEAQGDFSQMGRFIIEANQYASAGNSWRNPDALLKGFRNKNIHGLIDWQLGIDLLSALRDQTFTPGFSENLPVAASSSNGDWISRAESAAFVLAQALGEDMDKILRVEKTSPITGVLHSDDFGKCLLVVSHPLWSYRSGEENTVARAIDELLAETEDCQRVRMVDIFNLERRVSWVRKNLGDPELFPVVEAEVANPDLQNGQSFEQVYAQTLEGNVFVWNQAEWEKLAAHDLWTASSGKWLVVHHGVTGQSIPETARVRRMPGDGLLARGEKGTKYRPNRDNDLKIIAKPRKN